MTEEFKFKPFLDLSVVVGKLFSAMINNFCIDYNLNMPQKKLLKEYIPIFIQNFEKPIEEIIKLMRSGVSFMDILDSLL